MKKGSKKPPETSMERYDWSKAKRGRYASRFPPKAHAIVIDAEIYGQDGSAEAINQALALLITLKVSLAKLP